MQGFRYLTALLLLRCRELRLVSVWHPSFLALLLDTIRTDWDRLVADVRRGHARLPAGLAGQVAAPIVASYVVQGQGGLEAAMLAAGAALVLSAVALAIQPKRSRKP